jgi:steroid delta-isomerase-like uncharacterized protein
MAQSATESSTEAGKRLAEKFCASISRHDLEAALGLLSDDFHDHAMPDGSPPTKEAVRGLYSMLFTAFPDFKITPDTISAEGDMVALHATYSGTSSGPFMGHPASGKQFTTYGVEVFQVRNGQFVERHSWFDVMKIMREIA